MDKQYERTKFSIYNNTLTENYSIIVFYCVYIRTWMMFKTQSVRIVRVQFKILRPQKFYKTIIY